MVAWAEILQKKNSFVMKIDLIPHKDRGNVRVAVFLQVFHPIIHAFSQK